MPCRVIYYTGTTGRSPAVDFLDAIRDRKVLAAVLADISLLADEGPVLPFPLTSAIASHSGLRELRTRFAGTQIRSIYKVVTGDAIILHMFKKSATAQAKREYDLAAQRARSLR